MKSLLVYLIILILMSCSDNPVNNNCLDEFCGCPAPYADGHGYKNMPAASHSYQRMSPDGKKLAFIVPEGGPLKILDLKTGDVRLIDIASMLPENVKFGAVIDPVWCPYNSDKLIVVCATFTDTTGDNRIKFVWGLNAYMIKLDTDELIRITPKIVGPAGCSSLGFYSWLNESQPGNDKIHIGFAPLFGYGSKYYNVVYVYQKDEYLEPAGYESYYQKSNNGKYFFRSKRVLGDTITFMVNDIPMILPEGVDHIQYVSWSPDDSKIALTVRPYQDLENWALNRYDEIWIIDIAKFLKERPDTVPVKIINLRREFCMFSLMGAYAEFISNNSFAVSLHKDGDKYSLLWEVGENRKLIRQLTFEL